MSKKRKTKDRIKLPKQLFGVKIPKDKRRRIEARLKDRVAAKALVDSLIAALMDRLEAPQAEVVQIFPSRESRARSRRDEAAAAAH